MAPKRLLEKSCFSPAKGQLRREFNVDFAQMLG